MTEGFSADGQTAGREPATYGITDHQEKPVTTAWPETTLARYLTVGGATADVIDDATDNRPAFNSTTHRARGVCTGELCEETFTYGGRYTFHPDIYPMEDEDFRRCVARVQEWAQSHAEKCRAMPKPQP